MIKTAYLITMFENEFHFNPYPGDDELSVNHGDFENGETQGRFLNKDEALAAFAKCIPSARIVQGHAFELAEFVSFELEEVELDGEPFDPDCSLEENIRDHYVDTAEARTKLCKLVRNDDDEWEEVDVE